MKVKFKTQRCPFFGFWNCFWTNTRTGHLKLRLIGGETMSNTEGHWENDKENSLITNKNFPGARKKPREIRKGWTWEPENPDFPSSSKFEDFDKPAVENIYIYDVSPTSHRFFNKYLTWHFHLSQRMEIHCWQTGGRPSNPKRKICLNNWANIGSVSPAKEG